MGNKSFKAWLFATRPWSFTASALTVISVLAYLEWSCGNIDWLCGGWAVIAIILFHAAGNTWSDLYDYRSGIDAADTHGIDTLTSGLFSPAAIRNLSLSLYAAAIAAGLGLMLYTGLPLLWVGLSGLVGALLYPLLKRIALGDVVIMLNYCILPALGTSYVAIGRFELSSLWVALPIGLLVDGILHANNTRDMRTDRRAHAYTLAQALGVRGSALFYLIEEMLPFLWVAALIPSGQFPLWSLLIMLLLPVALRNCRMMLAYRSEDEAAAISSLDQASAQLQLLYSGVLTLSLLLDTWLR